MRSTLIVVIIFLAGHYFGDFVVDGATGIYYKVKAEVINIAK
jgi:hypothetical protein